MTEKERNEKFTRQALSHKNGQGKPIETKEAQPLPNLPKDSNGQVIIPYNVSEQRLTVFKSVMKPVRMKSAPNATSIYDMTGF